MSEWDRTGKRDGRKVSLIVPVYNAAPYLGRCMASILGQSYKNLEIILVDDGSTDESGRMCDCYAARYGQVKAIHTQNQGVSSARNTGMDVCSGEYMAFVDADDVLAADMVERLVNRMEENGCEVAGCGYFSFKGKSGKQGKKGKKGESKRRKRSGSRKGETEGKDASVVEILCGNEFMEKGILRSDTRCWSKLYRKESVGGLRFDARLTIGEDMLFLLELARQGKKFCRDGYKGYGYFVNEEGAMLHGFQDRFMDQITCWQRALQVIKKDCPDLTVRGEAILLTSVLLVVGKLAALCGEERKKKAAYAQQCLRLAKTYGGKKAVFRELDRGYKVKVYVYCRMPKLYMMLYHLLCYVKTLKGLAFTDGR